MLSLTMANGHDPVSGLSFRKVTEVNPPLTNGRHFDKEPGQKSNGLNVKGGIGAGDAAQPTVDVLRLRLKKGRVAANRNGAVYDAKPGIPFYNNNGPMKAFPINNNTDSGGNHLSRNMNNSSLPNSESDLSSVTSSSADSSPPEQIITPNTRPPLQRLHGRDHIKQKLPPGLTDPSVDGNSENGGVAVSKEYSSNSTPATPLKSALTKHEPRSKDFNARGTKETVTFGEARLPPGISDIFKQFFVPGLKASFQHDTDLPLLVCTDSAILRRRSSITQSRRHRLSTSSPQTEKTKSFSRVAEDATAMSRSRSSASDIFVQPDMKILQACWNIILCFMGDDNAALTKNNRSIGSIVSQKRKKIWRKSSGSFGLLRPADLYANKEKSVSSGRPKSLFVKDDANTPSQPKKSAKSLPPATTNIKNTSSLGNLTVLEKVHFIVRAGLTTPFLRDEIYCMIMKQLVDNPFPYSAVLGWILLALMTGSFAPSEMILEHVQTFIDHHRGHAWGRYCAKRLHRTILNGPRTNPPSSLEIQAARAAEPMTFPITCMDNTTVVVAMDPASTSSEVLDSVAADGKVRDTFGCCIVMKVAEKIINLGAGRFPIMDALSHAEIHYGKKFAKADCRLYYRRDIFSPRDMFYCEDESDSLLLTFAQVCGGVKAGEYYCKQAPDLSLLIAHQYSILFGVESVDEKRVGKFCERCLPYDVYRSDKKNWCRMVTNTINALRRKQGPVVDPRDIMAQVIRYTMQNLSKHFVRAYSIMTFNKVGSLCTFTSDLSLTLSHEGVVIRKGNNVKFSNEDSAEKVVTDPVILLEIPATSLKKVRLDSSEIKVGSILTIGDIIGGNYEITSAHGPEIYAVLFRYIQDISTGADKESNA